VAKIAYNACYGGFGLSHDAIMRYAALKGLTIYPFVDCRTEDGSLLPYNAPNRFRRATEKESQTAFLVHYCTTPEYSDETYWSPYDAYKDRADSIQVIEELGENANGQCAKIRLEEVPSGTLYRIDEYDGLESVATQSTYEWSVAP